MRIFSPSQHRAGPDSTGQYQTVTVNPQALGPPERAAVMLVVARVVPRSGDSRGTVAHRAPAPGMTIRTDAASRSARFASKSYRWADSIGRQTPPKSAAKRTMYVMC